MVNRCIINPKINRDLAEEIIMKTLILNGSPRKNGDTASLIEKITEKRVVSETH